MNGAPPEDDWATIEKMQAAAEQRRKEQRRDAPWMPSGSATPQAMQRHMGSRTRAPDLAAVADYVGAHA